MRRGNHAGPDPMEYIFPELQEVIRSETFFQEQIAYQKPMMLKHASYLNEMPT